ncbi:Uncharacterised protein [Acinetobacter baumannii]|nr:Uncharacterised protein [Acinetobacter baumannii]
MKKGRNGGFTPFDLLNFSIEDNEIYGKKPSKLFQEFAISMKGARQLVWSRGLKKLLGIEEKSDEELAVETDKASITLNRVEDLVFELLCRYQLRHQYLEAIKHDYETGSFGSGLADQLIEQVVNYEIKQMQQVFS